MGHIQKRWPALLLVLAMLLSLLPSAAFAVSDSPVKDTGRAWDTYEPLAPPAGEPATIAAALAGKVKTKTEPGDTFTVKGVVTLADGKNLYIQDATGAICLRAAATVKGISLGDTVVGTGERDQYYDLPQLNGATVEKSQGMKLVAREVLIADLKTTDICSYVCLKGVTVESLDLGASMPQMILKDDAGSTIKVHKVKADATLQVGDKLDICAAVDVFKGAVQLRNTLPTEITKLSGPVTPPEPPVDPPVDPTGPVTIDKAVAGAVDTEFTVKGTVTMCDGWNVYLQDETGAIGVNLSKKNNTLKPGDTVTVTGLRKDNYGLPYLGARNAGANLDETVAGTDLPQAKVRTVARLTDGDIYTYVSLASLEITEIDDNQGQYKNPTITLKDRDGNTIQIYKAVADKTALKVGDRINVSGAVGKFQKNYQIRNTLETEITPAVDPQDTLGLLGRNVVIYNPANMKALSGVYKGFNNTGVDVKIQEGKLTGYGRTEIWNVSSDGLGHYRLAALDTGSLLSMDTGFNSMPLDKVNDGWEISGAKTADCLYIKNAGRNSYMEWYAEKGSWSAYYKITDQTEPLFAQKILVVENLPAPPVPSDAPKAGDQVFIFNESKDGTFVMGLADAHNASLSAVAAVAEGGKATAGNGGRVFTVGLEKDLYTFSSGGKYLAMNDKENLFLTDTPDGYAQWILEPALKGTGYMMRNKQAAYTFQGSTDSKPCYIEYFGGKFTGWTLSGKNGYDIYNMQFLPVANEPGVIMDGIVNLPSVLTGEPVPAYVSRDYTLTFTVDSVFGLRADPIVTLGADTFPASLADGQYTALIPAEKITGKTLELVISCTDQKDVSFSASLSVEVVDVPLLENALPAANSAVEGNRRPEISVEVTNAETFTAAMKINGQEVTPVIAGSKVSYTPAEDMADGPVAVTVTVTRADGKENSLTWKFSIGQPMEQLYFGQLHSHTTYSDGAGSLEAALSYVSAIPERDNVDFVSFTDHSNYFDKKGAALAEEALYYMTPENNADKVLDNGKTYADNWKAYKQTVADFNAENNGRIALAGFEMTWSGGPGHINTFNTPGIVSRNNSTLNKKTGDAGMKAYYALLNQDRQMAEKGAKNWDGTPYDGLSISQFNHPGKTFGTFKDFAYWDPVTDQHMFTVEVGNGEGKIHQGGYYPSYGEYTKALDKGWHLAPTNNQDNHKGRWGNANDARDVILTDDFSEEGIYNAIRAYRMYATEDKNLELYYNVNDLPMGSIITEVPEALDFRIELHDPDLSDAISKVELVVNSGRVAYTWDKAAASAGELTCTLTPEYSYYYVRVTQADGDLAVSAPVWVGDVLKLGISSVESDTAMPVTGEELHINTTVFNSEAVPATVTRVVYSDGSKVLLTDEKEKEVPAGSNLVLTQAFTFTTPRLRTLKVTVDMLQDGKTYSYSMDVALDVEDADKLVYIGFDASHYNEYVAGNYKDSMGNFANLASGYAVRTVYLSTSQELIDACSNPKFRMLILTAPSRRLAEAQKDPRFYSPRELEALKAFNAAGGTLVLAGWSDHYESEDKTGWVPKPGDLHMSEAQNAVLEALGSSLRINDDATYDDKYSKIDSCDPWRLYFNTYNMDNPLNEGVIFDGEHPYDRLYTEVFSHYGGASIYAVDAQGAPAAQLPDTVSPIVFAHESTYSKDTDGDGKGVAGGQKYAGPKADERLLIAATETLPGKGDIIVAGAAFMSNFEVQAVMDNGQEKNYSNYRICENLVKDLNAVTVADIAEVQAEKEEGIKFTIEGIVTSNASGYDKSTAFFDCIYLQDGTAGINAFPVADAYKIGDRVRITGHTSSYNGERQIAVKHIQKVGEAQAPAPRMVTSEQINDGSVLGSLITLSGTVRSFSLDNGLIQTIMVDDGTGQLARVFIDGYITKDQDVQGLKEGCRITVTGLASYDNSFNGPAPRIRIRNRADVICTDQPAPARPFTDVPEGAWFYEPVYSLYDKGLIEGVTSTLFAPQRETTRGMLVTLLWRIDGEPEAKTASGFRDVPAGWYYEEAINWAAENNIVKGHSSVKFAPEDPVTREQAAAILYRYATLRGMATPPEAGAKPPCKDADRISGYAVESMIWAMAEGILQGFEDGTVLPQNHATRAQVTTMLQRLIHLSERC